MPYDRYKTRLCSFGRNCNRPICFFAHDAMELRVSTEEGKEMDEREYLAQLMMAQESGLLPALPQGGSNNHPGMHPGSGRTSLQLNDNMMMGGGGNGGSGGGSYRSTRDQLPEHSFSGPVQYQQPQLSGGMDATSLLMSLQESLASMGNNGGAGRRGTCQDLPSAGLIWDNAPLHGHGGRLSDPGMGDAASNMLHRMAAAAAAGINNPMAFNRNRVSDSGQKLGSAVGQDRPNPPPHIGGTTAADHGNSGGAFGGSSAGASSLRAPSPASSGSPQSFSPLQLYDDGSNVMAPTFPSQPPPPPPRSRETSDHLPLTGLPSPDGGDGSVLSMSRLSDEVYLPPPHVVPGSRDASGQLLQTQQQQQPPGSRDNSGQMPQLQQRQQSVGRRNSTSQLQPQYPGSRDCTSQLLQLQQQQPPDSRRESSGTPLMYVERTSPESMQNPFFVGGNAAAPAVPIDHRAGLYGNSNGHGGADAYVTQLVAQLQEQGVVNSKEQLIQSLSQLLGQLLASNN